MELQQAEVLAQLSSNDPRKQVAGLMLLRRDSVANPASLAPLAPFLVQRFVVPRVVRRLPASRGVKYAVRDRNVTPLIDPEFNLRIRVLSMRFGGTNADLLPCMDVSVSLIATATEINTWQSTIAHCTVVNGSATTNELDNFYEEMADLIYERVDGYFETR